jgi:transcriptional regulator with XRE-family HTH domain
MLTIYMEVWYSFDGGNSMENDFQYRLQKAIAAKGITASELSRLSGVNKVAISNYINGVYVAKQDKCYLLAKALNIDAGWLMTGIKQDNSVHDLVNNAVRAGMVMGKNMSAPLTEEARIISGGIDKMPPERREQALKVLQTIFADYFNGGEKDET